MYEKDPIVTADNGYLKGLQRVFDALEAQFPPPLVCSYHPTGTSPQGGKLVPGSFMEGAMFFVGQPGEIEPLPLERAEIVACSEAITRQVQLKLDQFISKVRAELLRTVRLLFTPFEAAVLAFHEVAGVHAKVTAICSPQELLNEFKAAFPAETARDLRYDGCRSDWPRRSPLFQ